MANRGKFNKKGFTLSEALIVVAVISILLALAVPNVIRYSRELKLAELDDSAKAIYMAAQNRLNALIASGEDVEKSVDGSPLAGTGPGGGDVSTGSERTYVSTSAGAAGEGNCAYLVPAGSIESQLAGNCYVVEYNALTGVVFAVWYWEDADDFAYSESIQSRLVVDDPDYDAAKDPATRDYRLAHGMMVGYYGGTDVEREKLQQMPKMNVTLTNAEELVLEISIPNGISDINSGDYLIDVEINGVPIVEKCPLNPTYDGKVVLDTLKPEEYTQTPDGDFSGWTVGDSYLNWYNKCVQQNSKMPLPGRDIVITVTLSHAKNEYLPRVVKVAGNSLFAGLDSANEAVTIKYGRHLQNLDPATSGFNAIEDADKNAQTVATSAMLIGNIDFKAETYTDYTTDPANPETKPLPEIQSWQLTYGYETLRFTPITNDVLTSFDGNNHTIRYLNAGVAVIHTNEGDSYYSGLFNESYYGTYYNNIVLVNPKTSDKADYAGALFAISGSVTIQNCHVYLDAEGMAEARAGGLFIQGNAVGGLVGLATYTTITNSSASVPVSGVTAGGLVGSNMFGKIENCYAAGYVKASEIAGGLIGNNEAEKINNSYAAGEIDCENASSIGGLLGTNAGLEAAGANPTEVTDVYAAVRYTNIKNIKPGVDIYGLYKGNSTHYFIKQNGLEYADETYGVGTANELNISENDIWKMSTSADPTLPYKLIAETQRLDDYPYPRLKNNTNTNNATVDAHYGDWLEENNAALVYYEVRGGQYYINGKVVDAVMPTETAKNTLYDNLAAGTGLNLVNQDGYGILLPGDNAILLPTVNIGTDPDPLDLVNHQPIKIDGSDYTLYTFENPLDELTDYYTPVKIGDYDYWYNPFFPCEVLTENDTLPADGGPAVKEKVAGDTYGAGTVLIRSARHLANMELFVPEDHDYNYEQLLNVDFKQYIDSYYDDLTRSETLDTVITLAADHYYHGNKHTISNMTVDVSGNAGLFSSVEGTVSDVTLIDMSVRGANAGTLAGVLATGGKVSGCGSYASNAIAYETGHTVTATGNAGGLIGQMDGGSVTSSYAAVKVSGGTAGGFVGSASGGTIESSFSGGHTVNGIYTSDTVNVTGTSKAGGFAGSLTGNAAVSAPCYSTCSAQGPEGNVGQFAGVGTPTTHDGTLYAIGMTFNSSNTPTVPVDGELLTDPTDSVTGAETALTYDNKWTNSRYPYLATGVAHHGDWPVRPELKYYEDAADVVTDDYYFLDGTPTNTPYAMKPATDVIGDITGAENGKLSWAVHNCDPGSTFYMTLYMNGFRAYFNPHFAETVVSAKPAATDVPTEVKVNSARQLANISKYTTGDGVTNGTVVNGQGWTYAQGKNIDFATYTGWADADQFTAGKSEGNLLAPANLAGGQYLGQGKYINHLFSNGGLFATVNNNSTISDLTFKNSSAMSTTSENVGLLAGTVTDSTIMNVVVIDSTVSANGANSNAGALAGTVEGATIQRCGARIIFTDDIDVGEAKYINRSVTGTQYVGGLIGSVSNTTVTNAYAAVRVYNGGAGGISGGFAGVVSTNSKITDCFAGGHTKDGAYKQDNSINVSGVFVGGFVGSVPDTSSTFANCYSTCSVSGITAQGPFVAANFENVTSATVYGIGTVFGEGGNNKMFSTPIPAGATTTVTYTFPYDPTLKDQAFPYANTLGFHYGDWSNNKLTFGVFYRDFCSTDNKYEYYLKVWQTDENGQWPVDPIVIDDRLCDKHIDGGTITETAYGFFFAGGTPTTTLPFTDIVTADFNNVTDLLQNLETLKPGIVFDNTVLNDLKVYTKTDGAGPDTWNVGFGSANAPEVTVDYRFGAAFGDNSEPNRYQIRNVQQLMNISGLPNGYFKQTHDIPAGAFNPIPLFTGQYNGGGYQIQNININVTSANSENGAKAALFATANSGYVIENVVLVGGSISASNDDGKARAGGIVADSNGAGTIRNCVVAVDKINARGSGGGLDYTTYVGGISANFTGTITNCQVYTSIEAAANSGIPYAGGIVGEFNGGTITLSYSGGTIVGDTTHTGSIMLFDYYLSGGIAGTNNSGSITYCYTYMTGADRAIVCSGNCANCAYVNGKGYNNRNSNGAEQITPGNGNQQFLNDYFHLGTAVETGNDYVGCTVLSYDDTYVHYGDTPW